MDKTELKKIEREHAKKYGGYVRMVNMDELPLEGVERWMSDVATEKDESEPNFAESTKGAKEKAKTIKLDEQ